MLIDQMAHTWQQDPQDRKCRRCLVKKQKSDGELGPQKEYRRLCKRILAFRVP